MTDMMARNKHLLDELANVAIALKRATTETERNGLEDLMVYLTLELEKRARFNHYYEQEKPEQFWERAAAQFRIGETVAREINAGRENANWIRDRVEYWVNQALEHYKQKMLAPS
ncbi:hypothetical protein HZC09_00465 [Candidatus Micrarchaeota archaeon]|nr:hypothetical protein [Candidatus Micrarchaeota archaeon]